MRKGIITWVVLLMVAMPTIGKQVTITILATTDVHGNLSGYDYAGDKELGYGLMQAAGQIRALRKERKAIILVDLGDIFSGNALTYAMRHGSKDGVSAMINAMNRMAYDVVVPGNHDFDFGPEFLVNAVARSRFQWTSANIMSTGTNTPLFNDTVIVQRAGVKVGFFGLTTPATARIEPPANVAGVSFLDMVDAARAAVKKLKAQGADIIVCLSHSGLGHKLQEGKNRENAAYQLVEQVPGIDVILFGHSHKELPIELYRNVLLCQPKDHAQSVGVVMVDLQKRDGRWEITAKSSTTLPVAGNKPDRKVYRELKSLDSDTRSLVTDTIGDFNQELTTSDSPLAPGNPFFLLNDAARSWKPADVVVAPMLTPGLEIKSRRAAFRYRHLFQMIPYDQFLVRFRITGKALHQMMEYAASMLASDGTLKPDIPHYRYDFFGGVEYRIRPAKPEGSRVEILKVNDHPFDAAASYTLIMTAWQFGEGSYFQGDRPTPLDWCDQSIRELVVSYIHSLPGNEE